MAIPHTRLWRWLLRLALVAIGLGLLAAWALAMQRISARLGADVEATVRAQPRLDDSHHRSPRPADSARRDHQ